jgi:hypothetical protein
MAPSAAKVLTLANRMKLPSVLALWFLAPLLAASPMDDVKRLLEEDVSSSQRPNIAAKINGILALEARGDSFFRALRSAGSPWTVPIKSAINSMPEGA